MNEKNYFTIVVPLSPDAQKIVQGNPSAVPLRAAVWSQAAERMKPLLGGVCSRFSPATAPYGEPLHLPFGVALGGAEAEQFLLCYFPGMEIAEQKPNSFCSAISMPGKIKRRRSRAALRPFERWAERLVSSILMKKRL